MKTKRNKGKTKKEMFNKQVGVLLIIFVILQIIGAALVPFTIEKDRIYLEELNNNFGRIDYSRDNGKFTDFSDSDIVRTQTQFMKSRADLIFKQNTKEIYFVNRFIGISVAWLSFSGLFFLFFSASSGYDRRSFYGDYMDDYC